MSFGRIVCNRTLKPGSEAAKKNPKKHQTAQVDPYYIAQFVCVAGIEIIINRHIIAYEKTYKRHGHEHAVSNPCVQSSRRILAMCDFVNTHFNPAKTINKDDKDDQAPCQLLQPFRLARRDNHNMPRSQSMASQAYLAQAQCHVFKVGALTNPHQQPEIFRSKQLCLAA